MELESRISPTKFGIIGNWQQRQKHYWLLVVTIKALFYTAKILGLRVKGRKEKQLVVRSSWAFSNFHLSRLSLLFARFAIQPAHRLCRLLIAHYCENFHHILSPIWPHSVGSPSKTYRQLWSSTPTSKTYRQLCSEFLWIPMPLLSVRKGEFILPQVGNQVMIFVLRGVRILLRNTLEWLVVYLPHDLEKAGMISW